MKTSFEYSVVLGHSYSRPTNKTSKHHSNHQITSKNGHHLERVTVSRGIEIILHDLVELIKGPRRRVASVLLERLLGVEVLDLIGIDVLRVFLDVFLDGKATEE